MTIFFTKNRRFWLSKILHQNQESMSFQSSAQIIGTANYIPPEIWEKYLYTSAGDIYAFSMIVYEIMTLTVPFEKVPFLLICQKVKEGERPAFKYYIDEYKDLIERCWSQNPEKRPTFSEIVEELRNNAGFITSDVNAYENDFELNFKAPPMLCYIDVINLTLCIKRSENIVSQMRENIHPYDEASSEKVDLFPQNDSR